MSQTLPKVRRKKTEKTFDAPARRFRDAVDPDLLDAFIKNDDDLETFARALHDPEYAKMSFPNLLRKFNIPLSKLQAVYTDGMRHLGLLRMSQQLPEIMATVAEDAKSKSVVCSRCDGLKVVRLPVGSEQLDRPCPSCGGKGEITVMGDKHARDLVFETMKLTAQPGGPLVAIQQNFTGGDDSMEAMFKTTQMITIGRKEAKEDE